MPDPLELALEAAWSQARLEGALGPASIETLTEHTAGYVSAVCSVLGVEAAELGGLGVDVGSGVGVPGILLAAALPLMRWRLVDSSERRCDHARKAAVAAGVSDRVEVVHARAEDLAHSEGWREAHDLGVARLLGAPGETAELLLPLVRAGGVAVVSVDDAGCRAWERADLSAAGAELDGSIQGPGAQFVALRRVGAVDLRLPRRRAARLRRPLF